MTESHRRRWFCVRHDTEYETSEAFRTHLTEAHEARGPWDAVLAQLDYERDFALAERKRIVREALGTSGPRFVQTSVAAVGVGHDRQLVIEIVYAVDSEGRVWRYVFDEPGTQKGEWVPLDPTRGTRP